MARVKKKKSLLRRIIRWMIALIILGIAGVAAYFVYIPMLKAKITTTYDAYQATTGTISNSLSFSGNVNVISSEYLYPSGNGTVRDIYVSDGSEVEEGDRLVRLSTGETVKANFDGTVNDVMVEKGDSVSGSTQLCQVVDFSNMKVTMRVDEYDISKVYVGQECIVTVTALEKSFPSVISHINRLSASNGNVAYYTVTATVEVTEDVLPGMQATISIPKEQAVDVVVVKMDALSFDPFNNAYVYVMNDEGKLEARSVTVGVDNGNYIEIKSGIASGEMVYVEVEEEVTAASGLAGLFNRISGGNNVRINGMGGRSTMSENRNGNWSSGQNRFPGGSR
ncbi:MAG: HlyD family efflux transporter periplasmic adaptor subunit [Clostridia bacterium]|nr:HlyD family efflux transporter periplasmic adaptor subunit [Clostridia bacterium]